MIHLILSLLISFSFNALAELRSDTIPYPFYDVQADSSNKMMILNRGEESLEMRLKLIRQAQESIDVEYYIFNADLAGKIFARELIKAAERGVKIRILVDRFMASSGINNFIAKELEDHGIEVKYYNTSLLINISTIHYRNHRKLLIIDDREVITGGRNIGDEYFNLDQEFNFEDRDVYIKGSIVKAMKESFEAFYHNAISKDLKPPRKPIVRVTEESKRRLNIYLRQLEDAKNFLSESPEELVARKEIEKIASAQLKKNRFYVCPEMTFTSDAPGANFIKASSKKYRENFRHVRKTFEDKILTIDKSLTISSPYFIANDSKRNLYEHLLNNNVNVTVYTNSLKSTDAVMIAANYYLHLNGWLKQGMQMFLHDGTWSEVTDEVLPNAVNTQWGTHAKTHIYEASDYTEIMIGTYNIDNRSDYYNTELAVFCKGNDDLTKALKEDIMKLANRGLKVKSVYRAINRENEAINVTGASLFKRLKMKFLTLPSWTIDYLL